MPIKHWVEATKKQQRKCAICFWHNHRSEYDGKWDYGYCKDICEFVPNADVEPEVYNG